jgi:hypothetical protein
VKNRVRSRLAVLVSALAVLAALPVVGATSALAAAPPWEPDPNALGTVSMYNATGTKIAGGTDLSHLADYFAASSAKSSSSAFKATLYFAAPDHTQTPDGWFSSQASTSTVFPNASAPAPIKGPGFAFPLVSASPTSANLLSFLGLATLDSTAGYANTIQLRVYDDTSSPKYWTADISYDTGAGTWQQVYPVVAGPTGTTTALDVTPASPQQQGTPVTLKATVTPTAAAGNVQFYDGSTAIGTPVAVAAGIAQTTTSALSIGSHSLTAKFTPTNPSAYAASTSAGSAYTVTGIPGSFHPLTPCRVFDTRATSGTCPSAPVRAVGKLGPGATMSVKVTGVGGVPDDATAVVMNVTAVTATAVTYITVFPHGVPTRPTVSNLNVNNGQAVPNLTIMPIGTGGMVDFFNATGTVNLIGDISGYFEPGATGSTETSVPPCRVFDTRFGNGGCTGAADFPKAKLGPDASMTVMVRGVGGVPANATAVVLNITAVNANAVTYITAWPNLVAQPLVSNLNVSNSQAVPNLAIVPIGTDGRIKLYNRAGFVNLIGDVSGYFAPGAGSLHTAVAPCRVFDTRSGNGNCTGAATFTAGALGADKSMSVLVRGVGGVPANATAVVMNVTAASASGVTFITVWPGMSDRPLASNLNVFNGGAIPNLTVVPIGSDGKVQLYNASGSVQLIGDIAGYFAP